MSVALPIATRSPVANLINTCYNFCMSTVYRVVASLT